MTDGLRTIEDPKKVKMAGFSVFWRMHLEYGMSVVKWSNPSPVATNKAGNNTRERKNRPPCSNDDGRLCSVD